MSQLSKDKTRRDGSIVIVMLISFYSPICIGQETVKGFFSLRVQLPPGQYPPVYNTRSATKEQYEDSSSLVAVRQAGKQ